MVDSDNGCIVAETVAPSMLAVRRTCVHHHSIELAGLVTLEVIIITVIVTQ